MSAAAALAGLLAAAALLLAVPVPRSRRVLALWPPGDPAVVGLGGPTADLPSSEVPPLLDLLAACLAAGSTLDAAVAAAAGAVGGPAAAGLRQVVAARAMGLSPDDAVAVGFPSAPECLTAAGRLLARSETAGASPVDGLGRLAEAERQALRVHAAAEARTVGVLVVLPLGLFFLPAFVVVGVVPLVAGVATSLWG